MITKFLHWLRWQRFLLWKETSVLLKERKSRFILIVPLFVQVFLFAYAATFDLKYVPFVLIDESNSKYSREIVAKIEASHIFTLYAKENNPAELKELISPRKAMMAIHFQSDFASQIAQGTPAKIQVILDGRNSTTASLAAAELSQIISSYAKENLQIKPALEFENRAWYNPNLLTRWNFVTALCGTLSFIQVLMLSGLSVAREREQGNFDQLLVTPYSPAQILLAKATPPIIIGLLQAILVCIIAVLWFNIPFRGNFFLMFLGLVMLHGKFRRNWASYLLHVEEYAASHRVLLRIYYSHGDPVRLSLAGRKHASFLPIHHLSESTEICSGSRAFRIPCRRRNRTY